MHYSSASLWRATAFSIVALFCIPAPASALDQITMCVEPETSVASDVSRKRRSTRSDCDPAVAASNARRQSGVNARDAIAPVCLDRVTAAEAQATCRSRGLALPTSSTSLRGAPIAAAGRAAVDASLPVASQSPKLCAILRDVPAETETSSRPAGIENGFCVFNGNRVTTKVLRTRATCGVQCR